MKVYQFPGTATTAPKREAFGITLCVRWGDVCHPKGAGDWFNPPYFPGGVLRFFCWLPLLPWISWNLWGWKGYLGAKVYGADSPAYKNWMNPDDVYDGSQAIQFSGRLLIKD